MSQKDDFPKSQVVSQMLVESRKLLRCWYIHYLLPVPMKFDLMTLYKCIIT